MADKSVTPEVKPSANKPVPKQVGRRLYYELDTGNLIHDSGEMWGLGVEDVGEDYVFENIERLKQYDKKKVGVLQLKFGEHREKFARSQGIRIDPKTQEVQFNLPTEAEPPTDMQQLRADLDAANDRLSNIETMLREALKGAAPNEPQ